nr:odorant receptor [Semanotus bifasciatus]
MSSREVLGISLKLIAVCGLNPKKVVKPLYVFNFIIMGMITVLVIVNMILNFHMSLVEKITYLYYAWSKFSTFLFLQRCALEKFLKRMKYFKSDDGNSEEISIFKKYYGWLKLYALYTLFCGILVVYDAFTSDPRTIFGSYAPKGVSPTVLFTAELYVEIQSYFSNVGANILSCIFTLSVAQQLRILRRKIQALDLTQTQSEDERQKCMVNVKEIIAYHIFLVNCIRKLREINSLSLLVQIIGDVSVLCINMYGLTTPEIGARELVQRMTVNLLMVASFIFLFGYPSQLLAEEFEGVGESIYCNCDWYMPNIISIRNDLLLMLLMSQKNLAITAGGFTDVDNTTVLFMIKTAYSFFTYLQTVS